MVPANRVEDDRRCTSIREAVKFAKSNNLLGVMLDATILVSFCSGSFFFLHLRTDFVATDASSRIDPKRQRTWVADHNIWNNGSSASGRRTYGLRRGAFSSHFYNSGIFANGKV